MAGSPVPRLGISIPGLSALSRDIKAADANLAGRWRSALRDAAVFVMNDAARRASFSRRIPGSMTAGATGSRAYVRAGGAKAPHAAIYNQGGRHPVFGNRAVWVPVTGRHFMDDALSANVDRVADIAARALDRIVADAGFR